MWINSVQGFSKHKNELETIFLFVNLELETLFETIMTKC